jgi:hypothetical protein
MFIIYKRFVPDKHYICLLLFLFQTENKLRHFIYQEMKIPERIDVGTIHRLGKKNAERPRPIIALFLYYSDLDKAKKAGRNLRGTHLNV